MTKKEFIQESALRLMIELVKDKQFAQLEKVPTWAIDFADAMEQAKADIFCEAGGTEPCKHEEEVSQAERIALSDLSITSRTYNVLYYANLKTLGDVVRAGKRLILGQRNAGKATIKEIETVMQEYGLKWRG